MTQAEPTPTHNEHFGFVLVSCERADLQVTPYGVWVFGDEHKEVLPVPPPLVPRAGAIAELLDAINADQPATQDGEWGLVTLVCCEALVQSSASGRAITLDWPWRTTFG